MIFAKFFCLMFGIGFFYINTVRAYYKQSVPAQNMIVMAAGIAGFITLQWLL